MSCTAETDWAWHRPPVNVWRDDDAALAPVLAFENRGNGDFTEVSVPAESDDSLRREFARLAGRWEAETTHMSSTHDIVFNEHYQRIIGMGEAALPYIFDRMARRPNQWFWALRMITGKDPVPHNGAGNLQAMTERWLEWGRQNGKIK